MDHSGFIAIILIFVLGLFTLYTVYRGIKIIFRSREQERWCKIVECWFGIMFLLLAAALSYLTYLIAARGLFSS